MSQVLFAGDTSTHAKVPFTTVLFSSQQSRVSTAVTLAAYIVRADGSKVAGTGSFSQPDSTNAPGYRYYTPAAADTSSYSGAAILRISGTRDSDSAALETREVPLIISSYDPFVYRATGASAAIAIKQGETVAAHRAVPFTAVDSTNVQTRLDASALTFTVRLVKPDGTSVAGGGAVVQPDATNAPGCCFYVAATSELDTLGEHMLRISATGMETRELQFTVVSYDPYEAFGSSGGSAVATTDDLIVARAVAVVGGLTPAYDATRFREYRNEGGADFIKWAQANPASCLRRFQIRSTLEDRQPEISNVDVEERWLTIRVLVAYPQNQRAGRDGALDRDKWMRDDGLQIETAIGMKGRANFSAAAGYPDACWREGGVRPRIEGDGVDFVELVITYSYQRAV